MATNNLVNVGLSGQSGTGSHLGSTNGVMVTPNIGIPSSGTLTNCTGLPVAGITGLGTNVGTFLITPSSANLAAAITDETGSGAKVFGTSPTFVTPALGTPTSGNLQNCTGTGGLRSFQKFSSGTAATYTKPASVVSILVEIIGGGGGGGGISITTAQVAAAAGGGAGSYCRKFYVASAGTYTYTVGAAGTGGTAGANNGNNGGSTTFDVMTAPGGTGGAGDATSASPHNSGLGGSASIATGGDINTTGDPGGVGVAFLAGCFAGQGGIAFFGGQTIQTAITTSTSSAGSGPAGTGTGGCGAAGINTTTNRAGGDGGAGFINVWEFA